MTTHTALYTITLTDRQGDTQRVESCFETSKAAHRFAKRITWGSDVTVWQGQPGGVRC